MTFQSFNAAEFAPHTSGSFQPSIHKPALSPSSFPPLPYAVHDAYLSVGIHVDKSDIAARRIHNTFQPISRLNSDILEYLFLTGAFLASDADASSSSLLTRTILTYGHLTSTLRQVALRSARLWALLVDFEHGSAEWNAELLRRSTGVGLQVVWQWSKAIVDGAGPGTRSRSGSGRGRIDLDEQGWNRATARDRKRKEDAAKKARLDGVLQKTVLERATSLGFAVPAPYFGDVLLERLGEPGAALPQLESLKIVKSRRRRPSVTHSGGFLEEDEDDAADGKESYVPLAIIANAPRLRRLAIAECNLSFHELLPSSPMSIPSESLSYSTSPSLSLGAQHTLRHLQALRVADLPLRAAPTAHEWLRYLTLMPALEELVLEGAVLLKTDRTLRDNLKAGLDAGGASNNIVDAGRTQQGGMHGAEERGNAVRSTEFPYKSALPKLRVLTLDAALEDVAVFTTTLPLPPRTAQGRLMKWTLLCADVHSSGLSDVEKVAYLFADAIGAEISTDSLATRVLPAPVAPLALSVRATENDIYVHTSTAAGRVLRDPKPRTEDMNSVMLGSESEAGFSISLNLHSIGGAAGDSAPVDHIGFDSSISPTTPAPSAAFIPSVLATLAHTVLPHVADLELELPFSFPARSVVLSDVLAQSRAVASLTVGPKSARGVLRTLRGEHKRSLSFGSESSQSSWDSDSGASSVSDVVLLPSLRTLRLGQDSTRGPMWTALLRFLKSRISNGAPVERTVFGNGVLEERFPAPFEQLGSGIPEGRVRELERLGVEVVVDI